MARINVPLSDEAYRRAKHAAIDGNMLLKDWIEQTIINATETQKPKAPVTRRPTAKEAHQ